MSQPQAEPQPPEFPVPDHVFDGGDMDCGSGLILLIRQSMLLVPEGGVLELRGSEPSVEAELPPWCRMVGHAYLGTEHVPPDRWRHWVRKCAPTSDSAALEADKQAAKAHAWRLRARHTGSHEASVYARNFSWKLGQPASFEERDKLPSALESALGALLADILNSFASRCRQTGIVIDDLESNLRATLVNALAPAGLEMGDPSVGEIQLTCFITSPIPGADLRQAWTEALGRSPLFQTFRKACVLTEKLVIM